MQLSKRGSNGLSDLPQFTQLVSVRANIHTQFCPVSNLALVLFDDISSLIPCLCHVPPSNSPPGPLLSHPDRSTGVPWTAQRAKPFLSHEFCCLQQISIQNPKASHLAQQSPLPTGFQVQSYFINANYKVQGVTTWHDPLDPMPQP